MSIVEMRSIGVAGLLLVSSLTFAQSQEDFYLDFRTVGSIPPSWQILGLDAEQVMRSDRGGLRITLPANRTNLNPVGLSPRFALAGDFDVSLTYELLSVEPPKKGYGAGVNIFLQLHSAQKETARLAHYLRPKNRNVYSVDYNAGDERQSKPFATSAKKGQLKIRRKGSTLYFLAGSSAKDLQELFKTQTGTEDVGLVRVVANTGGSPTALDVRFLEVRLRLDRSVSAPAPAGAGSWLWYLLGGTILLLAAALAWRWKIRST